jgi:cell division protein FtsL
MLSGFQGVELPGWMSGLMFRITLTSAVAVMSICYICQTSNLSTSGYVLRDLENKVAVLQTDIQNTQVEIAMNSSMSSIQNRLKNMDMVEISHYNFITPADSLVAKR